jgi:hypothetical protein
LAVYSSAISFILNTANTFATVNNSFGNQAASELNRLLGNI